MNKFLAFDIGGTKLAWAEISEKGKVLTSGRFQTPTDPEAFIKALAEIITDHPSQAVGIGIAGTISTDHTKTILCPNIPTLSELNIVGKLKELFPELPMALDNDGRCALIGEVWLGNAQDLSSAVMVTVGTGIGGGIMQKGMVKPHPQDITKEVSRIVVDPTDMFPSKSGRGTVESFIGGRNLQERLQIDLADEAEAIRTGNGDEQVEAKEIWHAISYFFAQCMKAVHTEYNCSTIIIGGIGSKDLEHYLQDPTPCPVIAAKLGEQAGLFGAGRLAMDAYEEAQKDWE